MASTRSRPRHRETARPNDSAGAYGEHKKLIYSAGSVGIAAVVAFLALTPIGHGVSLAVQHFMLFYAGVLTLIALCASVGAGLVATDRMVLHPGQRVFIQAAHRAISFGAVTFLIIHIATEILAQRSYVIDAVVPFMSAFRTFYIGLGTIASDLIILLVITGIFRNRFISSGKGVWRWRAIHYTSYVAFVFGVWHGLLGGRPGAPYVDWSYGFVVAFVALGLAVRILSNSLRPKENLSSAPVADKASSGSAPMRAAAMFAELGVGRSATTAAMTAAGGNTTMLPAGGGWDPGPGPVAALPAGSGAPVYEPGYDGPPRYAGASSARSGPMPQVVPGELSDGYQRPPMPRAPGWGSGPSQRPRTGPMPSAPGPRSGGYQRPPANPMRQTPGGGSGAYQRPMTSPMPQVPDVDQSQAWQAMDQAWQQDPYKGGRGQRRQGRRGGRPRGDDYR